MRMAHSYDQHHTAAAKPPARAPDNLVERCQAMLFTLAELGADFARQIHAAATTAAERPGIDHGPMLARASEAFDRTTTGVRRTVLLIDRLAHPRPSPASARSPAIPALKTTPARLDRIDTLRAETLHPERLECVERPESLGARPVEQVVAGILADLGLPNRANPTQPPPPAANATEPDEPPPAPRRPDPLPPPRQRTVLRAPAPIPDG